MTFYCRNSSTFGFALVGQKTDITFTPTRLSLIVIIEVKMTSADSYCAFFSFRYYYYYYYFVVIIIITTRRNSYTGHFGHVQNQKLVPHTHAHTSAHPWALSPLCPFGERWRRLLPWRWRSVGRNIFN